MDVLSKVFCSKKEKRLEQITIMLLDMQNIRNLAGSYKMAANLVENRSQVFGMRLKNIKKLNPVCPLVLMMQMDLLVYVIFYEKI